MAGADGIIGAERTHAQRASEMVSRYAAPAAPDHRACRGAGRHLGRAGWRTRCLWMDLRAHAIVAELRRLMPEAGVAGGSFAHWLPHPRHVAPAERARLLETARRGATHLCLTDLLVRVGLHAIEPARLASGARKWPKGYTGSVSHKGTTVVAAIVPTDRVPSVWLSDVDVLISNTGSTDM